LAKAQFEPGTDDILAMGVQTPVAQALRERVERGGVLSVAGVSEAARAYFVALLHALCPDRPLVAVLDSLKRQEIVHQELQTWLGISPDIRAATGPDSAGPVFFPAWDVLPGEERLPHADVISERLETLMALSCGEGSTAPTPVVVTAAAAFEQRTFSPSGLRRRTRRLVRGDHCEPLDLVEWLEAQAYEPEAQVTQKGEIALRGGILDVFPLSSPWPVRLEFFGNRLESLRFFDPGTQISRETTDSVLLPPAGELGLLRALTASAPADVGAFPDHLPPGSLVLLFDLPELRHQARQYASLAAESPDLFLEWEAAVAAMRTRPTVLLEVDQGDILPAAPNEALPARSELTARDRLLFPLPSLEAHRPIEETARDVQVAEQQRRAFFGQLHLWLCQDQRVHVFCNNEGERQRFREIWSEYGLPEAAPGRAQPARARRKASTPDPSGLQVRLGALNRGFVHEQAGLVVVADSEIFGRYRVPRPRRLRSPHAAAMRSALEIDFTELEEGDYVVHLQHGIGRYLGLQRLPQGGGQRPSTETQSAGEECLVIEFAATDPDQAAPKLYVPVTQSHLVSKYVGAGKARPALNTLGGTRWAKTKAQAQRAVQDLAAELLALQAARESKPGHAFPGDSPWQREFEGAFLYEETPDQARAIQETKLDMERPRPMDRLICGDVGFGKTEVAVRAAFKSVMGGKQVAVLVPTTVLAQQHFNTFRERMADYPVRIELLSRYRTRGQQAEVLRLLAAGALDIVIGTHRLVQADVRFRDLGLVVVDEEQRFGVLQKERLKSLRQMVDVLTLSATPIPRTLYLALTGARDMSTIETPPQDRLPVQTVAAEYDERLIRDAILRELSRGGQVFFLHNRVGTIYTLGQRLQNLVPDARMVIGHGQMPAEELEEVMTRFVSGEADVLLSTTIIESGIDIPNANTIIIDRADRFGLSDLYQLRGRVGRYKHQAYAYFLLPRHATLLADARKRISAIRQYSSLGSGFKIALRDLEIRGAGNLLGPEQSGHITAVGFELYCQLLQQSVAGLKGERVRPRIQVALRLDFLDLNPAIEDAARTHRRDPEDPARPRSRQRSEGPRSTQPFAGPAAEPRSPTWLPQTYAPEPKHRIDIYRRLAQARDSQALQALRRELRDRFGPLPDPVERLLQVADLRLLAAERGVDTVETKDGRVMLTRCGDFVTSDGRFPRLSKADPEGRLRELRKLIQALQPHP
jgi:transcription-repair coupling factor (superfamily II helicase)